MQVVSSALFAFRILNLCVHQIMLSRLINPLSVAKHCRNFATLRTLEELDKVDASVYNAGMELQTDHPGFKDPEYRGRRDAIAHLASKQRLSKPIQDPEYAKEDHAVWESLFTQLSELYPKYACDEYNKQLDILVTKGLYTKDSIPSLQPVAELLHQTTGFHIKPVAGLLTPRLFLNAMALGVFCSTQYIRHHAQPHYTPEPDICHELLGHVPMLMDPNFAALSQTIGKASLDASDQKIEELVRIYWYSAEFGLCKNSLGETKAYGAGVLSSVGEIEHSMGLGEENPDYAPWEPDIACKYDFPIVTYQPKYYVAESLADAMERLKEFTAEP
jgi:phenylalanine-4-hydroxylase